MTSVIATSLLLPTYYLLALGIILIVIGINSRKSGGRLVLLGLAFIFCPVLLTYLPRPIAAVGFGICFMVWGLSLKDRSDAVVMILLGLLVCFIPWMPFYLIGVGAGVSLTIGGLFTKDSEQRKTRIAVGLIVAGFSLALKWHFTYNTLKQ
jgi:hypothetical protein